MEKKLIIKQTLNEQEMTEFCSKITPLLTSGTKVLLNGEMGAGKSFLTRKLLFNLGVEGLIPSPTFTLINSYQTNLKKNNLIINHADLYRLENEEELTDLGFEEMLFDNSVLFVEWGGKFPNILKEINITIDIKIINLNSRQVCVWRHN
jgi:tRNA threonylcarbamoyladenosine biosynthesis protein TsaE